MKEVKNALIQAENGAKVMDAMRQELLAQGYIETFPEVFERKNALGLPEQIRTVTPEEAARMKPGKAYVDSEAGVWTPAQDPSPRPEHYQAPKRRRARLRYGSKAYPL